MRCNIYINIYTDKTKIKTLDLSIQNRIIREGNEDNLRIKYHEQMSYSNDYPFISIEKLSGDIEFYTNINYKNYTYKNFILFSLNSIDDIIHLKIKAKKNSIYIIKSEFILEINPIKYYFLTIFGGNSLVMVQNKEGIYIYLQLLKYMKSGVFEKFINFYPINNCNKTIEFIYPDKALEMTPYKSEKSKNIFYQKIYSVELLKYLFICRKIN